MKQVYTADRDGKVTLYVPFDGFVSLPQLIVDQTQQMMLEMISYKFMYEHSPQVKRDK